MSKYTAEQVVEWLRQRAVGQYIQKTDAELNLMADAIEDILRERESAKNAQVTELPRYTEWRHLREKGVWSNGVPAWAKDHEGHMNDYRAAVAVIDELAAALLHESAKAAVTDEMCIKALDVYLSTPVGGGLTLRPALEAIAPMLASARVPDEKEDLDPVRLRREGRVATEWERGFNEGWNDCRETMLAAAPKPETKP